jgi:hypothetical protein
MLKLFRLVYLSIIVTLLLVISHIEAWDHGFDYGYSTAMSDVLLEIDTPENYFIKRFDIRIPDKVEPNKEQK